MTVVILSNLPSPLVLSRTLTRSLPGPAERRGYSIDLGDPDPAALVEGHGHGIDDVRLGGDEFDVEAGRDRHLLEGFLRRQRRAGRSALAVWDLLFFRFLFRGRLLVLSNSWGRLPTCQRRSRARRKKL